jgi:hypothetical protein
MNTAQRVSRGFHRLEFLAVFAFLLVPTISIELSTTAQAQGSFTIIKDKDSPGHDYNEAAGISLEKCEIKCLGDTQCIGFTFNSLKKVWFLKSKLVSVFSDFPGAVTAVKTVAPNEQQVPLQQSPTEQHEVGFPGWPQAATDETAAIKPQATAEQPAAEKTTAEKAEQENAAGSESQRLAFVSEYIRQLGTIEDVRDSNAKEFASDGSPATVVLTSTRMILTLRGQVSMLKSFNLGETNRSQEPVNSIIDFDNQKIDLWQAFQEAGKLMMAGPQPGVDYGKLAGDMPEITARIEYLDKGLFTATPLVLQR